MFFLLLFICLFGLICYDITHYRLVSIATIISSKVFQHDALTSLAYLRLLPSLRISLVSSQNIALICVYFNSSRIYIIMQKTHQCLQLMCKMPGVLVCIYIGSIISCK